MWIKATKLDDTEIWINLDTTWLITRASEGSALFSGRQGAEAPVFELVKEAPEHFMKEPLPPWLDYPQENSPHGRLL